MAKTRFELRIDELLVEIIDREIKNTYPPQSRNALIESVLMEKYAVQYTRLLKQKIRELAKPVQVINKKIAANKERIAAIKKELAEAKKEEAASE